jgi:hypothetical protein
MVFDSLIYSSRNSSYHLEGDLFQRTGYSSCLKKKMLSSSPAVLLALLVICVSAANNPACFSTTDQYIQRTFTVLQPSNVLVQRYQGSMIKIYCSSFSEAGPSCAGLLPTLCSRPALDASAAMTCETLAEFGLNTNAAVSRGSINGPPMLWLLQWDGTQLPPSCFPRVVNARLLAFVYNDRVESTAVFVILLIIAILSVLLILLSFFHHVRSRWMKIDSAGATAIAGPKMSYRGPQLGVTEPAKAVQPGITKVYLPVRDSGALSDMTADRMGALLGDPNTPRGKSIYLQGADGDVERGPGSSMRRRRRASPPGPGDGTFDPILQQKIVDARRMNRGAFRGGDDDFEGDEDAFDYAYDDDGAIDFDDQTPAGRARVSRWQEASERRRALNPRSGKKRDNRLPQRGALFPTQRNWTTGGDGDGEDSLAAYRSGPDNDNNNDEEEYEYEIGPDGQQQRRRRSGGPRAPGSQGIARQQVKYIPQWMHGSFGRGGVIPELGDGEEADPYSAGGHRSSESGRQPSFRRGPGNEVVAKQYYQKPPVGQSASGKENAGYDDETVIISENGQMRQVPRSALKGRRGQQQPGNNETDDTIRRGVSFQGDYVALQGGATPAAAGDAPPAGGGRAFTPASRGAPGGGRSGSALEGDDQFARSEARVHNRTLDLDPQQPLKPGHLQGGGSAAQGDGPAGFTGGPTTSRLTVVGKDPDGNPIYAASGGFGRDAGGPAAFQCADCGERIQPGSVSYCPVTGKRHY